MERALAPLNDVCDLGAVACGLMLLDSGRHYPAHAHRPQEIYLPISGDGSWRFGGAKEYRALARRRNQSLSAALRGQRRTPDHGSQQLPAEVIAISDGMHMTIDSWTPQVTTIPHSS